MSILAIAFFVPNWVIVTQNAYKAWRINYGCSMHFNMLTRGGGGTGSTKLAMIHMLHSEWWSPLMQIYQQFGRGLTHIITGSATPIQCYMHNWGNSLDILQVWVGDKN